ncbi:MAG: amino acid decarboxylase [Clostridia bacterium]
MNTPIVDFVRGYAASGALRLHMPGHKGVPALGPEALDITEVPGADVLYHAEGVIRESERNAAALFGSARTLYSAEGSSLCIRAMLFLALQHARLAGKKPLIAAGRNAHRVFLSGCALLGLEIAWLYGGEGTPLSCRVAPEALDALLEAEKPAAVYLTSPDYLGRRADLPALAAVCRKHGALLLVDNAHGAYLKFLESSQHPLDLGADLCCDSAHKTLPVLTGGACLHLSKSCPEALPPMAEAAMRLFASTSPSWLILQSLDLCNRALATDFPARLAERAGEVAALKTALAAEGWELAGDEPMKLTLCPKRRGYTGTELAAALEENGVVCEFADPDFCVFMFSPANTAAELDALRRALEALPVLPPIDAAPPMLGRPERVLPPREAMLAPFETLPREQALGRVLAAPTVSCPPAVPILVCGERIDRQALALFAYYGLDRLDLVLPAWEKEAADV